jgi:hypothetical protein
LEQRVVFLEESLEDISNAFINFTESMLKAEAIRQSPEILQNLLTTTSSITRLAKTATQEPNETPKRERVEDSIRPFQEEMVSATGERSTSGVPESSESNILASNLAAPSDLLSESDIFGNGWFSLKPFISHLSIRGAGPSDPDGDFAFKLIEITLTMAYNSLVDYRNDPTSFVMRMCRYALLYHSMEEILFNLRWFLGPGFLAMQSLSRANFGFDHTLSAQSFNAIASSNEAKVLSPFVDAQALVESPNKIPRLAFMNALDVEEYLKSKGAVHLGQDVVQLQVQGSSEAEGTENYMLDLGEVRPQINTPANDQYLNQILGPTEQEMFGISELTPIDSYFTSNSLPTVLQTPPFLSNSVNPTSNTPAHNLDLFDFNSLLEGPEMMSSEDGRYISARPKTLSVQSQTVSLCRSSLLKNLARSSICLGTGPAFPRASVDMAIESAIRPTPVF